MRIFSGAAILLACSAGCTPAPKITEGTFADSYTLTMQRGSMDVVVQTSGPASYKITNYSMDHPMGKRPDTEATFTTPAGKFAISDKNQTEPGVTINGQFYAELPAGAGRSTVTIDPQGVITAQPAKPDPLREGKP